MNEEGTFKDGFDGCVLHMMAERGGKHSQESAKKICGKIAQQTGAAKARMAIAQARLRAPLVIGDAPGNLPDEIQFTPSGRQVVSPFVKGEPREMEITVTSKYAEVFDRACQAMLARAKAGGGDFPFTDFNHNDDDASSRPTEFFWGGDDPKAGGVRMRTGWAGSGKAALANGDYARFSPQRVFDKITLEPLGLPCNVGGLVNRAAFKTIAPLASAHGARARTAGVAMADAADDPGDDDERGNSERRR